MGPGRNEQASRGLVDRLIRLEESRLRSVESRIDLQRTALEIGNEQDQRRADAYAERIRLEERADQRRIDLLSRTIWIVSGLVAVVFLLLLVMTFWGDDAQRQTAARGLNVGLIGLGGYGVLKVLERLTRFLSKPRDGA